MKKYFITTPIYYVNDSPHIGHSYTTIAADVIARWQRLHGKDVFFLTGTDEHGIKIVEAAKSKNKNIKDYCDEIAQTFKETWKILDITYNHFVRTTDPYHEEAVENFLSQLNSKGFIYKKKYKGLYCNSCENFLKESELVDGMCPVHMKTPVEHSEENYFFKLSEFREKLISGITDENSPYHYEILPESRKNEILGKLNLGLEDISISRLNLPWGIPLPFDSNHTTYVWIDALLNYISAIGYPQKDEFSNIWPADLHLLAKDILWFHAVIWPSMLIACNMPLPKRIYAHGFFTVEGKKMSKTLGNFIKPEELVNKFGRDATRYLLLSMFPFGSDGDFSFSLLNEKYNSDLANNMGNLVSRLVSMIVKYLEGNIENISNKENLFNIFPEEFSQIDKTIENIEFSKYIELLQKSLYSINQFIDRKAPWRLAKENRYEELENVINSVIKSLWILCHYIYPLMPETANKIISILGQTQKIENTNYFIDKKIKISAGKVSITGPLFPRI